MGRDTERTSTVLGGLTERRLRDPARASPALKLLFSWMSLRPPTRYSAPARPKMLVAAAARKTSPLPVIIAASMTRAASSLAAVLFEVTASIRRICWSTSCCIARLFSEPPERSSQQGCQLPSGTE